jgi:hypothetical protein
MEKSERLILLLFFLVMSGIFWGLYMLLGGSPSREPEIPAQLDTDLEFLVDDDDSPREVRRPSGLSSPQLPSSVSAREGIDRDQGRALSSLSSGASSKRPQFHSILKKYRRRAKPLPLPRKQAKLRSRLLSKGFKSQEYIEMKVLALDRKPADQAIREAASLSQKGEASQALALLGHQLRATDASNLMIRGELIQAIISIALDRGYPDTALNYQQQLVAIQDRVNSIKRSTILMDNPMARQRLEREQDIISKWKSHPEALKGGIKYLRENKGLSPEVWNAVQASSLNAGRQMNDAAAEKSARNSFKNLRSRVSENWANPKSGDPSRD